MLSLKQLQTTNGKPRAPSTALSTTKLEDSKVDYRLQHVPETVQVNVKLRATTGGYFFGHTSRPELRETRRFDQSYFRSSYYVREDVQLSPPTRVLSSNEPPQPECRQSNRTDSGSLSAQATRQKDNIICALTRTIAMHDSHNRKDVIRSAPTRYPSYK